jgi:hypothetical protein
METGSFCWIGGLDLCPIDDMSFSLREIMEALEYCPT